MCQLLGVSVSEPIRLRFAWEQFARRGSSDGGNPDGWGIAYYEDRDVLLLREPRPAADSPLVHFLGAAAPYSRCIISHIRRATGGENVLANTQPFVRYRHGRAHVFAHNGYLDAPDFAVPEGALPAVGDTDSELLFAYLLSRLEPLWRETPTAEVPSLSARLEVLTEIAGLARQFGAANFIYCDGVTLFAHAHRHTVPGEAISDLPGLYVLERDSGVAGDDSPCEGISCDGGSGAQAVVATKPLDHQHWKALTAGEIACFENGQRIKS